MVRPTTPVTLDDGKVRAALADPDTSGFVLFVIALREFGDAVLGDEEAGVEMMDPAEMWADLHSRYGSWVTEDGENKLSALITGLQGARFWRDLDVFMAVSTALFDGDLGDMIEVGFEKLSATEVMWAVMEMGLAWDAAEPPEFSLPIQEYVDRILLEEQEDQSANAAAVEGDFLNMMDQLREMGVPPAMLRALDEDYAITMQGMEDGSIS